MFVRLTEVYVDAARNPRGDVGDVAELAASMQSLGVLQPVIVEPYVGPDGEMDAAVPWRLVAGYRRFAAAKLAGLDTLPATAREPSNTDGVALVENLQRENLSLYEEAKAVAALRKTHTQKQIAALVGMSASWVSVRIGVASLPPGVLSVLATGALPTSALATLKEIAKTHPAIAEACAAALAGEEEGADEFVSDPASLLDHHNPDEDLGDEAALRAPFCKRFKRFTRIHALDLTWASAEQTEALSELAERARTEVVTIEEADVDAARAYGCLLEVESDTGRLSAYVTDEPWLRDLVWQKLVAAARRADELAREQDSAAAAPESRQAARNADGAAPPAATPGGTTKEAAADRADARRANLNLGTKLWVEFQNVKPDLAALRALAAMIVAERGPQLAQALAMVRPEWQTEPARANGAVGYGTPEENTDRLVRELEQAKTPARIIGTLLQAFTAARWLDPAAVPQSRRYEVWQPNVYAQPLPHALSVADEMGRSVAGQRLIDLRDRSRSYDPRERAAAGIVAHVQAQQAPPEAESGNGAGGAQAPAEPGEETPDPVEV